MAGKDLVTGRPLSVLCLPVCATDYHLEFVVPQSVHLVWCVMRYKKMKKGCKPIILRNLLTKHNSSWRSI